MRARTITSIAAVARAAAIGYASVIERNWFALRQETIPVLLAGADPVRVLHISDMHLTPGRHRLMAFVRSLAALDPDLVINTGDSIASPDSIGPLLDCLGPLLDKPGAFVYGSNDLFSPKLEEPSPLPLADQCGRARGVRARPALGEARRRAGGGRLA